MVWKPTATMFTWPPVSFSQSGARRWSGSAIWGPLNVRILMLTPANLVPGEAAATDADGAATEPGADVAGADATETDGAGADGDGLAFVLQAAKARIGMIAAATNR